MILNLLYVLICGIALPVGGVQMQYLWRNQLGDIYSLGLGSAACLGAAAATMSGWCSLTVGAFIAQGICAVIVSLVAIRLNTSRLITFGIIFGTFVGSLCTIVVTNAPTGDLLKQYYLWGAANFKLQGVTAADIVISLLLSAVSICGTVGFVSLAVPNLARVIVKPGDIRIQYGISAIIGIALLMVTFVVVEYCNFGIYLPVSATMALIALPLSIILFRNPRTQE